MKPSEDQLEDKLNLLLWFPLPDSVGIDSITWKSCQCLSVYLAHFFFQTQFPLCALTRTYLSFYLHSCHPGFLSIHVSMRWDPPPLLCWHLTFITAWPWLSLLSSLLWCSITLSSWGKHWCQATVMTFWLSVFMWWMRWKCTTTAKRGWRRAKLPRRARGRREQGRGKQPNK